MRDKYNVSDYIIYFTGLQSSIQLPVKYNATYKEQNVKNMDSYFRKCQNIDICENIKRDISFEI